MAGDCQNQMLFMKNAAVKNIRIQGSVVKNQVYRTLLQKLSQLSRTLFNQIYLYMGITRYKGRNQRGQNPGGKEIASAKSKISGGQLIPVMYKGGKASVNAQDFFHTADVFFSAFG